MEVIRESDIFNDDSAEVIEYECAKAYGITCICENEDGEYVVNYEA